ncbi:MAG: type II toxin-antitoxin system RelE/ParE family toxin [Gammaproteobacteria bacterium]
MKLRFLEPASAELAEAISYYEEQLTGLGGIFEQEVRAALRRIQLYPHAWHPLSRRTRTYRLRRFPFGVIYEAREKEILIVAIAHQHRRPEYWKRRTP